MIDLNSVSKWYVNQSKILEQVSFQLKQGEFLYVVGGSGAGKSSLLRILATKEAPSIGSVSLFGYNLANIGSSTLRTIRQCLGCVPQGIKLIPDFTVYENIALSLSLSGRPFYTAYSKAKISELLNKLGLESKRDKLAFTLSGGESQRVAIARALVRAPELIIADEPTGAQDRDFTWSLMDLFLKANLEGSTVILATHDREIIRRLRKKCAVLRGGRVSVEDSPCFY
jgi:cell division transport system ATP-binding protein